MRLQKYSHVTLSLKQVVNFVRTCWKFSTIVVVVFASLNTVLAIEANAATVTDLSKVKSTKIIYYESVNGVETIEDLLSGKSFTPQILKSKLYLPKSCKISGTKVPAVIIQHGSGRPQHRWYPQLANKLAKSGIAALVANSYSQREISSTARDQTQLSLANRIYDAFAAFHALGKIPCIDPDRIGITGYSFGGIVARHVIEKPLADLFGDGHYFKASLPVYPSCSGRWKQTIPTNAKVHFLLAQLDDYTPAKPCLEYIPEMKAAGWNASYTVYKGAHHGFIADKFYGYSKDVWTFKNCGITYINPDGTSYNKIINFNSSVKRMTWTEVIEVATKSCARKGVTTGLHPKSKKAALKFTVKYFSESL